ncbi:MAG: DUF1028 domain-containing protein [Burkholderiales bacterium]|nr:DUF1028 domain-containing protein [Burkholderiales bacterium]
MTITLVACCPRTGRLGLATASERISVGLHCDGAVHSNVGATFTQGFRSPRNNALALRLLAQGFAPASALDQLRANDPDCEAGQIAVVDREGEVVAFTGARAAAWSGHRLGAGYAALGNRLRGETLLGELADAFEANGSLDLEERLLKALEAARAANEAAAQHERQNLKSVALVVFGRQRYSDIDLRVDLHDDPVAELRRLYDEYQPFAAYYVERGKNPRNALPQREFADMLYASRAKKTT